MKTLLKNLLDRLTDAAMLEEGIRPDSVIAPAVCDPLHETIEENLVEVAFAEAADYNDIHQAILHEHLMHCKAA